MQSQPPKKIIVASTNKGKLVEIQALVDGFNAQFLLPADIHLSLEVAETENTYAGNAILKARAYCQASRLITLADDSGLEVDVLDGAPGVHSARYSPVAGASDADRRRLLLDNLRSFPQPWRACFYCSVALAHPDGRLELVQGVCPGQIIPEERGSNGFGYDPIFLLEGMGKTMAELSIEEKNQLSHRARAVKAAMPILKRWVEE